jgi:hypothetical protein
VLLGQYEIQQAYAVGWGSLALLTAGVAQGKNRCGLAWFLLAALLGPIATFTLVVFFEKRFHHDQLD